MIELLSKERSFLEKACMEFRPFGVDAQGRNIRDVSGLTVRASVHYLEEVMEHRDGSGAGARVTEQLCRLLNERIRDPAYHVSPVFLRNAWNSYSYEFVCFLSELCMRLSNDPAFHFKVGREKFISPLIQTLGRPFTVSQIYRMFRHFGEKYAKGSIHFEVVDVKEGSAVLRMGFTDHVYRQFGPWRRRCADFICQSIKCCLAAVPEKVHHLPVADVKDRRCIAEGADYCEWESTWDTNRRARLPHLAGTASAGIGGYAVGAGIMPDGSLMAPVLIALLSAGVWEVTSRNRAFRRSMAAREQLIQEQLESVEGRHEELREAYLQQGQAAVELRKKVNHLATLHRAGLLINSTLDRESLIQEALRTLIEDLPFDRAMISFFDPARGVATDFRICGVSEEVAAFARAMEIHVTDPSSPEGTVLLQGESICVEDIREVWDRLHPLYQELAGLTKAKSLIAVPLKITDRVFGSITVDRTDAEAMNREDLDLLITFSNQVAIALDNARTYHTIEELNLGLEEKVRERAGAYERANRELEAANARLQELDLLKSRFVSTASHELRTPMTSIKGYVRNMLDGLTGGLSQKQRQYLERVQYSADRLMRVINNLLDLSRIEAGAMQLQIRPVLVEDVVSEAVEELHGLAQEKNVGVTSECESPAPVIRADRDKVQQILSNLLQNAIAFTPPGGRVGVHTHVRPDGQVQVSVTDTGEGIPSSETEKIFFPFYRGHSGPQAPRGTGLGLAISKDLVELHGGRIWVESTPGKGSRFVFTMPAACDPAENRAGAQPQG